MKKDGIQTRKRKPKNPGSIGGSAAAHLNNVLNNSAATNSNSNNNSPIPIPNFTVNNALDSKIKSQQQQHQQHFSNQQILQHVLQTAGTSNSQQQQQQQFLPPAHQSKPTTVELHCNK